MFYRMNWHAASRTVNVETGELAAPAAIGGAFVNLGAFEHDNETEESTNISGMQNLADNHVVFHHVRDALYFQGVQDMQSLKIYIDRTRVISIGAGVLNVAVDADAPLTLTVTPTESTDTKVTYSSSAPAVATVNEAGVVHGVAAGNAVITATLVSDNTITVTRNVTVA